MQGKFLLRSGLNIHVVSHPEVHCSQWCPCNTHSQQHSLTARQIKYIAINGVPVTHTQPTTLTDCQTNEVHCSQQCPCNTHSQQHSLTTRQMKYIAVNGVPVTHTQPATLTDCQTNDTAQNGNGKHQMMTTMKQHRQHHTRSKTAKTDREGGRQTQR